VPNIIFFGLILCLYFINTQREYWKARNIITDETNNKYITAEYVIFGLSVISLIYGFTDYVIYQKSEYGDNFNWLQFLLGGHKCKSIENNKTNGGKRRHKK